MNEQQEKVLGSPVALGFWVYLMSDCLIFASFFATYAVQRASTFGGPGPAALFDLPYALAETLVLLTSSFTAGLASLASLRGSRAGLAGWLAATLALGLAFLGLEGHEFTLLIAAGHGPAASGFLSAYFALVGVHGLHVAFGSLWLIVLLAGLWHRPLTETILRRVTLFALFWHFLDIIWILIFTIVYLSAFV